MELRRGTETVLVVDDEAMVRDLARDILKRYGYAVIVASGGEEAVELYRENRGSIAVVILDILMPGVDGREAFRRIREIDPAARVIVSSGFDHSQDADSLVREGATAFVQKPYRIAELVRAVGEAIEKN
jgi:two-component system cell cycle sensor histidine kinase/response regulator CckA